jgi:hypothetical protein
MRQALADKQLLGSALESDSWQAWRALLIAAMGEELTADERALFQNLTGRPSELRERAEEFWCVAGRRGGKTRAAAILAVYMAALVDHKDCLSPGERGLCFWPPT